MRLLLAGAVVCLLLGGTPSPADATVLLELDLARLVRRSALVVEARVRSRRPVLVNGRVWTESVLDVQRALKGIARRGQRIRVRALGGELGGRGLRVAGTARYGRGEHVVAFLRAAGGSYTTVGMCQGKYEIFRDGRGALRVRRDLSSAALARLGPDGRLQLKRGGRSAAERLETFLRRIRDLVALAGAKPGGGR